MRQPIFTLTPLAILIAGAPLFANAAIYTVERVDNATSGEIASATAISEAGNVGYEIAQGPTGIDFSQELPFMVDMTHTLVSQQDLDNYCFDLLGYSTCNIWTSQQWWGEQPKGEVCEAKEPGCKGGYANVIDGWFENYVSNFTAFYRGVRLNPFGLGIWGTEPVGKPDPNSTDVVINDISSTDLPIGASSSAYYEDNSRFIKAFIRRGYIGTTELMPPLGTDELVETLGQTNANGSIGSGETGFVYGSASVAVMADPAYEKKSPEGSGVNLAQCTSPVDFSNRACQYVQFANQAAIWLNNGTNNNAIPIAEFPSGATGYTTQTAQASIQDAAVKTGDNAPTLVGFNTVNRDNFYATAVKFEPVGSYSTCIANLANNSSQSCWTMSEIPGTQVKPDGDLLYRYSIAKGINANGIIIGEMKNANPVIGGYPEYVFVYDSTADGNATILSKAHSELFFNGYNASANAINDKNEMVGKVDVENVQNRQRRQRGYIYLHGNAPELEKFNNQRAWLLDDLTNDDVISGKDVANEFRIIEAHDINGAGDIAASAYYCQGGYSSIAQDATCDQVEEIVAVKLTRKTNGSIIPRSYVEAPIERSGAGIGIFALCLLAGVSFFRKKFV